MRSVNTARAARRRRKAEKRLQARARSLNGPVVTRFVDPATIEFDRKSVEIAKWLRENRGV